MPTAKSRYAGRRRQLALRLGLFGLVALFATGPALAEAPSAAEYEVKAAFLYNFLKFVDWPAPALAGRDAIVIGVVGDGPLGSTLERTLQGKTVHALPIVARRIVPGVEPRSCHVVFIAASAAPQTSEIVKGLEGASVLTVGESERFAQSGGMIGFKVEANKVRFDINRDAAERAGLHLSSQLLKLASNVVGSAGGPQ